MVIFSWKGLGNILENNISLAVGTMYMLFTCSHFKVFHTMTDPSSGEVLSVAKLLWTRDQRELHYCAVDILIKYKSLLASNAQICAQSANVVRHLLTEKSWWDTVDLLASNGT